MIVYVTLFLIRNYYAHRTPVIPDVRLSLLSPSIFADKRILDLGCNAAKLTIECVTHLSATSVHGIDLDPVLIENAIKFSQELSEERRNACSFVCADFMQDSAEYFENLGREKEFDVILLFSITKWLHLHHGDSGLLRLFAALYQLLPPNGILIVEPQEWGNYKKAVGKNKSLRPVFKEIKMRPPFEFELKGVGFGLETTIEREEGGFSRPLLVWRKV